MAVIKEESEDVKIEDTFRVKQEDTEEQTGWFSFSKLALIITTCYTLNVEQLHRSSLNKTIILCNIMPSIYFWT